MLAEIVIVGRWGLGELIIAAIVLGACVGILYVALRAYGIEVPEWVTKILWIVVIAVVAVVAVRVVLSL